MSEERKPARLFVPAGGGRVDRLVAAHFGIGRRRAHELIEQRHVRVGGKPCRAGHIASAGTVIEIDFPSDDPAIDGAEADGNVPREQPRVLWQTDDLLVLYKPKGFHSVRGRGRPTLADFVRDRFPSMGTIGRATVESGLVHRLDRDTSGLMLAAKDAASYDALRASFAAGSVLKEYLAIVLGRLEKATTIDVPLVRKRTRVRPAHSSEVGMNAVTTLVPLELGATWTLVSASMRTGVTHQIRAHLALAGHPVIGDVKYGPASPPHPADGHLLHARRLTLANGTSVAVDAGTEFLEMLASLRRRASEQAS